MVYRLIERAAFLGGQGGLLILLALIVLAVGSEIVLGKSLDETFIVWTLRVMVAGTAFGIAWDVFRKTYTPRRTALRSAGVVLGLTVLATFQTIGGDYGPVPSARAERPRRAAIAFLTLAVPLMVAGIAARKDYPDSKVPLQAAWSEPEFKVEKAWRVVRPYTPLWLIAYPVNIAAAVAFYWGLFWVVGHWGFWAAIVTLLVAMRLMYPVLGHVYRHCEHWETRLRHGPG